MAKHKVLIVGGGFGGVKAALTLAKDDRFTITLLSKETELRYYPTLYHTATGGKYANSSIPLAAIFEGTSVNIAHGNAKTIDRKSKTIRTFSGESYQYETLILGIGVATNFYGIPGLDKYSYSIKTQEEVKRFKAHLHQQLQQEGKLDLNYVIIGAGPTGIELAGALPGYLKQILNNHGLTDQKIHVDLIEAMPRLLPRLPKKTSRAVKRRLKKLGIKIYLGKAVQAESVNELTVSGKPIRSHTVVWTAGVTNSLFFKNNDFVITKRGKISVDAYLQAEENIYVIGDNANTPYSGMAQTALHDGEFVANNLIRLVDEKAMKSYTVKQPITVIPVGPGWATVIWGKLSFSGRLGWLLREASNLIGFHDLQPWPKAVKQYLTQFEIEDNCPVCAKSSIN